MMKSLMTSQHCVQALHRTDAHLTSQDAGLVKQNSGQLESVEVVVGSFVGMKVGDIVGERVSYHSTMKVNTLNKLKG